MDTFNIGDEVVVLFKGDSRCRVGQQYTIVLCEQHGGVVDDDGKWWGGVTYLLSGGYSHWVQPSQIRLVHEWSQRFDEVYNA